MWGPVEPQGRKKERGKRDEGQEREEALRFAEEILASDRKDLRSVLYRVNILLPFEKGPAKVIQDDPKVINFRYFFTRKVFFVMEADAVALFPGGFGTHDEGFEVLTLLQTGKAPPMPVVLMELPGERYWE